MCNINAGKSGQDAVFTLIALLLSHILPNFYLLDHKW